MEEAKPVGLIGVGAMGRVVLELLRKAGRHVKAYDIAEPAQAAAREGGAEVVKTAAEAANGAAFVHVFVLDDENAMTSVAGEDGILAKAAPGAMILLHSTVMPATTRRLAELAGAVGVDLIDATITATPPRLRRGQGEFFVGGAEAVVARARPQLLLLAPIIHHFGPVGAGNVAKIAKASINASERVLFDEVLQIVAAGGLDVRQFMEMERLQRPNRLVVDWEHCIDLEGNKATPHPTTNLMRKDVFLAAKLADSYGLPTPLTHASAQTAVEWIDMWARTGARRRGRDREG